MTPILLSRDRLRRRLRIPNVKQSALYAAAAIFALVSLAHWIRYFMGWEITVGGSLVPLSLSIWAGVIAAALAAWMTAAARRA